MDEEQWFLASELYRVTWKPDDETAMLHIRIHHMSADGKNHGVVLEVSPNLLDKMGEGDHFVHKKVTCHLLEAHNRVFDENRALVEGNRALKKELDAAEQRIEAARQMLRKMGFTPQGEAIMNVLSGDD